MDTRMKELNADVFDYSINDSQELYIPSDVSADDTEFVTVDQERLIHSFELGLLFE